jgi:hypothetical protein
LRHALAVAICMTIGAGWAAPTMDDGLAAFGAKDYDKAFEVFQALSEGGDARATFYLSLLYGKGYGVEKNPSQALYMLKRAAEAGDRLAQYNLGNRYNRRGELGYDPGLAAAWWEKAAKQGLALAQHNLGSLYALGQGVDRDLDKARYWYHRAIENGSEKSLAALEEIDRLTRAPAKPVDGAGPAADTRSETVEVTPDWIDSQPEDGFTVQLAALSKREDVERLLARHDWQREPLIYHVGAGGGAFWGLGYGVFADAGSARAAIDELPDKVRAANPWPRALADIRKRLVP